MKTKVLLVVALTHWICAPVLHAATYSNPVLAGDFPDPSVIRVGADYWATATTSEWAPLFPLLHSRDLVHWEHIENVFERRPAWAVGNFWAPEISEYKGVFYVYYVGRKRGGPLSISVATAPNPKGPWTDHGPMIGQEAGSIDPVTVVDTSGERYLIWKEDGNSRKRPTPLWIQKLSADGTRLVGDMKEIMRNDTDWEGQLIEGPFVQRHADWWYLFYSGAGCCGRGCNYALGVARSKNLLGPWEKNPANPILSANAHWKCPGHGTIVSDEKGRDYLLYHSYETTNFIYVGRQGLLDEVTWASDGWPTINSGRGPSHSAEIPIATSSEATPYAFVDDFTTAKLKPQWQWPQNNEPRVRIGQSDRGIILSASEMRHDDFVAAVLAVKTTTGNYLAATKLSRESLARGNSAGLSAFGDGDNALGASIRGEELVLWRRQRNKQQLIGSTPLPPGTDLWLRMKSSAGHRFQFAWATDGKSWKEIGTNIDLEGDYLPPWDRGIRVALVVGGGNATAKFYSLHVSPDELPAAK